MTYKVDLMREGHVELAKWRFADIPPYISQRLPPRKANPERYWLFRCQVPGCGHTEFESMSGGTIKCDNCGTDYVVEWEQN